MVANSTVVWCEDDRVGSEDETNDGQGTGWFGLSYWGDPSARFEVIPAQPPSVVRLAPEYGVEVPLWPNGDATDSLVPADLLAKLIAWQAFFDSNFEWDTGWCSDDAKSRWAEEAVGLEAEPREALAGKVEVVVDLWPLKSGETTDDSST